MSIRRYDFATGIETSDAPSATPPSLTGDIMTLGYADTSYARRRDYGWTAASYAALTAIGTSGDNQRYDGQVRLVTNTNELWRFDSASSSTPDGESVLSPDSGTGRWHIISGGGAGAGGGTAESLEMLQQKIENERYGVKTTMLDDSVASSSYDRPPSSYVTGYLIESYSANASGITVVWNPVSLSDSDRQVDSTTSWTAVNAGTTLSTSGTDVKMGSNKLTFDKDSSATLAAIRYDRGSQNLSLGANTRLWFYINIPSTTNLSSVHVRVYADTTSNYRTWALTTTYSGAALSTGWNLMFVDLSDTTGTSTGGSGWLSSQLVRYVELGVNTSSAGQTYSAIAIDSVAFSLKDIAKYSFNGLELTMHDTSTKDNFTISTSNAKSDGYLLLASVVNQAYTAGITNSGSARLNRSTLDWEDFGLIGFEDNFSSGEIALEQELRLSRQLRESQSMSINAYVDMYTPQIGEVYSASGSSIWIDDPSNLTGNYLSGDQVHVFETINSAGERTFVYRGTKTLTANSSSSGGYTLLPCDTTSVVSGDFVAKQHLEVASSLVAKTSSESFTVLSYSDTPNGAQLIDAGQAIPNPNFVYAHWLLGAINETLALRDLTGSGRNLTKIGSPNLNDSFVRGQYSASTGSNSDYVRTSGGTVNQYDGVSELIQVSFWLYFGGTVGANMHPITAYDDSSNNRGWIGRIPAGASTVQLTFYNADPGATVTTSNTLTTGAWNHVVYQIQSATYQRIWLNGIATSNSTNTIATTSTVQALYMLASGISNVLDGTVQGYIQGSKMAQVIIWKNGPLLTSAQIQSIHNSGAPQATGFFPILRNEYRQIGQSGQRLSMRAKLNRSATTGKPIIYSLGEIKS